MTNIIVVHAMDESKSHHLCGKVFTNNLHCTLFLNKCTKKLSVWGGRDGGLETITSPKL